MKENLVMKKQRGIGLLELVLGIALLTIILVSSMHYFQVARQSGSVNESLLMVKAVYGAAEIWRAKGLKFSDSSGVPEGSEGDPLLKKFAQLGLLTSDYESVKHTPWGGELKASGEGHLLKITLSRLSKKACEDIRAKLESNMTDILLKELVCTSDSSGVLLNFVAEIK